MLTAPGSGRVGVKVAAGLIAVGAVVLTGLAALLGSGLRGADMEDELRHQMVAERVFDEMERELSTLIAREEARPFLHYRYFYVPEEQVPGTNGVSRSPLAMPPADPHVIGYFQLDPDGTLTSPLRPNADQGLVRDAVDLAAVSAIEARLAHLTAGIDGWGGPPELVAFADPEPAPRVIRRRVVRPAAISKADPPAAEPAPTPPPEPPAKVIPAPKATIDLEDNPTQQLAMVQQAFNRGYAQRSGRSANVVQSNSANVDNWANPAVDPKLLDTGGAPAVDATVETGSTETPPVPEPVPDVVEWVDEVVPAPPAPRSPPQVTTVEVEVSPLNASTGPEGETVLHRTVRIGDRTWVQGVALDTAGLLAHLEEQVVGDDLSAIVVVTRDSPATATYRYPHRFAEPFTDVAVWASVTGIETSSARTTLLALAVLVALVVVVGLVLAHRLIAGSLQLAQQRSDFVSAVTHELKTPLTSIQMYSEMLQAGMVRSEERKQDYYATISSESQRLGRLVDDVLAFSRLERGRSQELEPTGSVGTVVDDVRAAVAAQATAKGVQIDTRVDPEAAPLRVNQDGLAQVLVNLVDNGIKFSAGAATKRVEVTSVAEADGVRITVRDHGPGAPPRVLRKMFRPFFRGEHELVRRTKGTGIGLALVRGLVEAMSGEVSARNHPAGGLEVTVRLPAQGL